MEAEMDDVATAAANAHRGKPLTIEELAETVSGISKVDRNKFRAKPGILERFMNWLGWHRDPVIYLIDTSRIGWKPFGPKDLEIR